MTTRGTKTRKNAKPPAVRGRRGHSSVDQQAGLARLIDEWLLETPKPTYDEMVGRLKGTRYHLSRSSLARYGMQFEIRKREMRLLLDKARALAAEDPESILDLERAISQLAGTKLFSYLLDNADKGLDEEQRQAIFAHAKLQSSSAARERARLAYRRKFEHWRKRFIEELQEALKADPKALKIVLRAIERTSQEDEDA